MTWQPQARDLEIAGRIVSLVASDKSGRFVGSLCRPETLVDVVRYVLAAQNITLVTGFYTFFAGAPETDGLCGTLTLARGLLRCGKNVRVVTDPLCMPPLAAGAAHLGIGETLLASSGDGPIPEGTDLLFYVERLGRADDGKYYNMRGVDQSSKTPPLDIWAVERPCPVVGIGDGGNEVGMGNYHAQLAAALPDYAPCLSRVTADVCLPADVSDWGAYGVAELLARTTGFACRLEPGELDALLGAVVGAGAVDGVSGKRACSVDTFEAPVHRALLADLKNA